MFDDFNWTVFDTLNSGLPNNNICDITIDDYQNKWIATVPGGFAKYDDINWTTYDSSNSELPSNIIWNIAIDKYQNKWIGTSNGLAVYMRTE